jgi:hypothetical protein
MAKSTRTTKKPATPEAETPSADGAEHDAVARRAYEIYQERGGNQGSELEDWLQAERELSERRKDRR